MSKKYKMTEDSDSLINSNNKNITWLGVHSRCYYNIRWAI